MEINLSREEFEIIRRCLDEDIKCAESGLTRNTSSILTDVHERRIKRLEPLLNKINNQYNKEEVVFKI
jgi:hypothetical protein